MDTNDVAYNAPKVVTLAELERRRDEFDVPDGAIAALRAGSSPAIVFLRSTGEQDQLADPHDDAPPGAPRPL